VTLYTKQMSDKGKVTYQEYKGYTPKPEDEMTDGQMLTFAISLSVTCLNIMERSIPTHKRNSRKIKALEQAIFDAAQGHGEHIDKEFVDFVVGAWNHTMHHISNCKPVPPVEA
jgi:hypothetical protein